MDTNKEIGTNLPEIYFDHRSGSYWVNNDRDNWMKFNESSVKRLLKSHGISAECGKTQNLSPLDETILKIQTTKDIGYAASLVIAGEPNSGKSLLQTLITQIVGGRSAKPYRYMSGKTEFNSDLFQAEHQMIEDEMASTDIRTRRNFGSNIKQVTVNVTQSCHPKGQPAITLTPFWRTTITLNDETENLLILPPFEPSIVDKIILLKAVKKPFPVSMNTLEERNQFMDNLLLELPAFLYFLSKWEIPSELKCERFGITHYHHPELVKELEILQPENHLLELIDIVLFKTKIPKETIWTGTARDLEEILKASSCKTEVEKILTFPNAMGTYLGRLQINFPKRVK